jgi:hypothetical protein
MTDAYSIRAMLEPDPPSDREPRPASVRIQRRIEWSDTDASGAYHNTAAFRLMEAAETTLVERLGLVGDIYAIRVPTCRPTSFGPCISAIWSMSRSRSWRSDERR